MNRAMAISTVLLVASLTAAEPKGEQAASMIQQVAEDWVADGWGANGSARYLRHIEDAAWQ